MKNINITDQHNYELTLRDRKEPKIITVCESFVKKTKLKDFIDQDLENLLRIHLFEFASSSKDREVYLTETASELIPYSLMLLNSYYMKAYHSDTINDDNLISLNHLLPKDGNVAVNATILSNILSVIYVSVIAVFLEVDEMLLRNEKDWVDNLSELSTFLKARRHTVIIFNKLIEIIDGFIYDDDNI